MSIEIEIRLYHAFRKYMPPGHEDGFSRSLSLPSGASVAQAMAAVNIPEGLPVAILLNGIRCGPEKVLTSGDVLTILQPAGGGYGLKPLRRGG